MSRTLNTTPYHVQRRIREAWRRKGYPAAYGGAWRGIKEWRKYIERQTRAEVRNALACTPGRVMHDDEGTPLYPHDLALPTPSHRNSAKWDMY